MTNLIRALAFAACGLVLPVTSFAKDCREDVPGYVACTVDLARLEVFWRDDKGVPLRDVSALRSWLASKGKALVFATNAGAFDNATRPLGLLVSNKVVIRTINLDDGEGNFFLKPNGVFWVSNSAGRINATESFNAMRMTPRVATQSGPLLVMRGQPRVDLHTLQEASYSRTAVCVDSQGGTRFLLATRPITIKALGEHMSTTMACASALYLDGCRSFLFSEASNLNFEGECFAHERKAGPMLGIARSNSGS